MDDVGAFKMWLVIVILIGIIAYLLWMVNRMRTPKEPVIVKPITNVEGAGT